MIYATVLGQYRIYTQEDIDRLDLLNELVKSGNSISDVAHLSLKELEALKKKFFTPTVAQKLPQTLLNIRPSVHNLMMGLDYYKLEIIDHELNKLALGLDTNEFATKVMLPLMDKIQNKMTTEELGATQLDVLCALLKSHLYGKLSGSLSTDNMDARWVLIAHLGSAWDEIQALTAALFCSHAKINFKMLNAGDSLTSVAHLLGQFKFSACYTHINKNLQNAQMHEMMNRIESTFSRNVKMASNLGNPSPIMTFEMLAHYKKQIE